jgi:hypothetical protein
VDQKEGNKRFLYFPEEGDYIIIVGVLLEETEKLGEEIGFPCQLLNVVLPLLSHINFGVGKIAITERDGLQEGVIIKLVFDGNKRRYQRALQRFEENNNFERDDNLAKTLQ